MMLKIFGTLAISLILAMGYLSIKGQKTVKESAVELIEMAEDK